MSNWFNEYRVWVSESQSLNNAQLVINHFADSSWSREALSALVGNMRHESSINPDMYEYGYDWGEDRGFGLVQWTPRSKYWNWAVDRGLPPREGESQLARLDYEVEHNIQWMSISSYNGMTFEEFRSNSGDWSVEYLTEAFTWSYERPNATDGEESMPERKAFALRVFNELDFSGSGAVAYPAYPTVESLPISSPYGWRFHPIYQEQRFHDGIDMSGGGVHHPIYATMDGTIVVNEFNQYGGWRVTIEHSLDDYWSRYQHFSVQSPLAVGTQVSKGQEIGTMGTSGDSTGIHLHFSIATRLTGFGTESGTIDPEQYLQTHYQGEPGGGSDNEREKLEKFWITQSRNIMHRRRHY